MKMYELLDSPEKWVKYHSAVTADGSPIVATDTEASRWCVLGALHRCYPVCNSDARSKLLDRFAIMSRLTSWNDAPERKYEDVITLLKELDV